MRYKRIASFLLPIIFLGIPGTACLIIGITQKGLTSFSGFFFGLPVFVFFIICIKWKIEDLKYYKCPECGRLGAMEFSKKLKREYFQTEKRITTEEEKVGRARTYYGLYTADTVIYQDKKVEHTTHQYTGHDLYVCPYCKATKEFFTIEDIKDENINEIVPVSLPAASSPPKTDSDFNDEEKIEFLKKMHDSGLITQEQFEQKRDEILSKM